MSKAKYVDTMIGTVADGQAESYHGGTLKVELLKEPVTDCF